jgi:DNA-binding NtrC family response regulator
MARVRLDIADPANRMTLRAILVAEGHEVVQENPHVIFADGREQAVASARGHPCVLVTRASEIPLAIDAVKQGVFGYVLVPFQPGEAAVAVKRALEWWRAFSRADGDAPPGSDPGSAPTRIEEAEARMILATLRQCKNNKSKTARLLGIGRNTLWRKLKRIREAKTQLDN